MLSNAIALAFITTGGAYMIYTKLPRRVRKFLENHALLADFIAFVSVYWLLGGTLTALAAASICGVIISGLLHIAQNKDDFLYLYDMQFWVKGRINEAKIALNEYSKVYRERRLATSN